MKNRHNLFRKKKKKSMPMTSAKHTALGFKAVLKWSLTRSRELSKPTVNLSEPPRHTLWVVKY